MANSKSKTLTIREANNGFIVTSHDNGGEYVFENIANLVGFIQDHFNPEKKEA